MVSIIVPMYNRAETISMAIHSILEQTYKEFEIIVVDDCSTDNSVEIVKQIEDKRIRIIECRENKGACEARNIGIEHARGNILAFQDSDDFWHKDKLEKSLYFLEKEKADFVFSSVLRIGEKGFEGGRILPTYNLNKEKNKLTRLLCSNCVSTQTIVAKKMVFTNIRFDKCLPRFQDWDLALQAAKQGVKMYYIEEPLVDCYIMNNSITSDSKKAIAALKILEKKYNEDLRKDKSAGQGFFYRAGCFCEKSGLNGAEYFMKAYHVEKNNVMLIRYILSKLRLYSPLCMVLDKFMK